MHTWVPCQVKDAVGYLYIADGTWCCIDCNSIIIWIFKCETSELYVTHIDCVLSVDSHNIGSRTRKDEALVHLQMLVVCSGTHIDGIPRISSINGFLDCWVIPRNIDGGSLALICWNENEKHQCDDNYASHHEQLPDKLAKTLYTFHFYTSLGLFTPLLPQV